MLKQIRLNIKEHISNIVLVCDKISARIYFTNIYGLSRSILALGTLLTLAFNENNTLFAKHLFGVLKTHDKFLESINYFFLFGFENLFIARLLAIIILLFVISGICPRITGIMHWWITYSFFSSAIIIDGGDQISAVITFFLIPITLMDSRMNHWINNSKTSIYKNFIAYIIFLIIEIQIAILYLQSSIEKPYKVNEWVDGTAIYYWFNHNMFGASELVLSVLNPIFDNSNVISFINWGVIIFELLLFGCFFMQKDRKMIFLKYALLFHFIILFFHGLVSFFFAMAGALVLYLIPKDYLKLKIKKFK